MGYKIKRELIRINEDYNDMQGPCPDGFHVPLQSEWSGLYTIMSGLSLTTGNNWVTNLHLPFAGRRQYDGTSYVGRGTFGNYRSSSYDSSSAYALSFDSSINYNASIITSFSLSIRPFKNSFVAPTSGWTVITGTLGGAGIFWNQTDGIISITSDGTTGYTIADKNLGATVVYNDGDTLSESNCGYNYQRGNNYGFPFNASVTTSSVQVNASNYGPGNYYSSSTFISGGNNWDSSNNGNLRGGVTQGSGTRLVEKQIYPAPYKREPTANTILYLPLESDSTDRSGNNVTTLNSSGVSFTTQGGLACCSVSYNSNGISLSPTNIVNTSQTKKTISVLLYLPSLYQSYQKCIYRAFKDTSPFCSNSQISIPPYSYSIQCGITTSPSTSPIDYQPPQGEWFHLVQTTESGTNGNKMYINGVKVTEGTGTNTPRGGYSAQSYNNYLRLFRDPTQSNSGLNGFAREMIWENVVRSADDVSNYYNRIKAKLGF